VRQSPGRRVARALLSSGPAVGGCWGAALIAGHAWTWPVPLPVRLGFGLTLLATVLALALSATTRRNYRLTRLTTASGLGLIVLDTAALASVAVIPPAFSWPLAVAVLTSLARVTLTVRTLPRLLTD
jgi:hypothetical protein